MSQPRKRDGVAAKHRSRLPRDRKPLRLDLRWPIYEKLLRMSHVQGEVRPYPLVAVIERLVEAANE